jgi:hypothetical protein
MNVPLHHHFHTALELNLPSTQLILMALSSGIKWQGLRTEPLDYFQLAKGQEYTKPNSSRTHVD